MTQLKPDDSLQWGVEYQFFEEERRTSFVSSLNFDWDKKPGHKNGIFMYNSEDYSNCYEENPEMLIVPTITSIDMESDYAVELNHGQVRASFKDKCSDTWKVWKRSQNRIRKLAIKVTESPFNAPGFNLQDYFTIEYRLVKGKKAFEYQLAKLIMSEMWAA